MEPTLVERLRKAAAATTRASELTHPLYRYPASMAPAVARVLVESFSSVGQSILDPFCGGGTSAVEALSLGRSAVCSDISPLACFVTRCKAHPMSTAALADFSRWVTQQDALLRARRTTANKPLVVGKSAVAPATYSAILKLMDSASRLRRPATRRFAQLVVLSIAKHCFDCRSRPVSPAIARRLLGRASARAVERMTSYTAAVGHLRPHKSGRPRLTVIKSDIADLASKPQLAGRRFPLVVTSPPYPGVHMLYHRWQVRGRKETNLPFALMGFSEDKTESYYTIGGRKLPSSETYFNRLGLAFDKLAELLEPRAIVAQVVAFPRADHHLSRYMTMMESEGYEAVLLEAPNIMRPVPNRRWYAQVATRTSAPVEYILIHRLSR